MRYAIQYKDGSFNQGSGFPCRLEEATLYGSRGEAYDVASGLCDVLGVVECEGQPAPRTFTLEQVAQAVEQATVELKVCVPSGDYYARPDDWRTETVYTIDPQSFTRALREM
jgi:hypothetical protein